MHFTYFSFNSLPHLLHVKSHWSQFTPYKRLTAKSAVFYHFLSVWKNYLWLNLKDVFLSNIKILSEIRQRILLRYVTDWQKVIKKKCSNWIFSGFLFITRQRSRAPMHCTWTQNSRDSYLPRSSDLKRHSNDNKTVRPSESNTQTVHMEEFGKLLQTTRHDQKFVGITNYLLLNCKISIQSPH